MEKSEQLILQFRTWNKKILLFDQYQKQLEKFPVNDDFALIRNESFEEDQKISVFTDHLEIEKLWPANADKEKRGIELGGSESGFDKWPEENLFIISEGYLYFDEGRLNGVLPVYLSRVLLEWIPFKSNLAGENSAEIEEAILIDDCQGVQSVYSLGGRKMGNSRLWAGKLRKYLLEKAENLGNLR